MRKVSLLIGFVTLVLAGFYFSVQTKGVYPAMLGGVPISIEIVDTDALRERGLSGRPSLGLSSGMLFVFSNDDEHRFWMKDMLFPIDILWLDAEYRIVDVHQDVKPETYPETFTPKVKARYVLELPAGFFENNGLKMGNTLEILK